MVKKNRENFDSTLEFSIRAEKSNKLTSLCLTHVFVLYAKMYLKVDVFKSRFYMHTLFYRFI